MVQKEQDNRSYHRTRMQKELIVDQLRDRGCRITRQRRILLDIILESDCSCCKEIFYRASHEDKKIGRATVYRMVNTLEEIGAISRRSIYRMDYLAECSMETVCTIEFSDHTFCNLSECSWNQIVQEGMKACGYLADRDIRSIKVNQSR